MSSQTTIKVSKDTCSRLKSHGKMGDSFEDVILELLDKQEHGSYQ